MQTFNGFCVAVISILTVVNVSILGLVIKLYTEYFKDRSQVSRQRNIIETGKTSYNNARNEICARFNSSCVLGNVDGVSCQNGCNQYGPRKHSSVA